MNSHAKLEDMPSCMHRKIKIFQIVGLAIFFQKLEGIMSSPLQIYQLIQMNC